MAIPEDLKPFLDGFTADETTFFDNLLTKSPKLKEGWLRQADYDRNLNKNKVELTTAQKVAQDMQAWYAENEPIHRQSLERASELEKQNAEIAKQLEEARTARAAEGGDTVDAAELERRVTEQVNKMGWVSKAELAGIVQQEAGKLAVEEAQKFVEGERKKLYDETLPGITHFAMDMSELSYDHMREFNGEKIDRKALSEFMAERSMIDPKKAYEQFVAPRRQETEFKKKVEDEVKQRMSGMAINAGGVPMPGPMEKGAIQMRIEKDAAASAAAGSGILAQQAAAELRAEGKQ